MSIKRVFSLKNLASLKHILFEEKLGRTIFLDALSKGLPYLFLPLFLKIMPFSEYGLYTFIIYIVMTGAYVFQFGFETAKSKLYFSFDKKELGRMLFNMNIFMFVMFIIVVIIDYKFRIITTYVLNMPLQANYNLEFSILMLILLGAMTIMFMRHLTLSNKVFIFQRWNAIRILILNTFPLLIAYFALNSILKAEQRIFYETVLSLFIIIPFYYYYYVTYFEYKIDLKIIRRVFKICFPIFLGSIISISYNLADKYFINKFIDSNALGIYNLTMFLIMPIGLLFTSFFDSYWVPLFFNDNKSEIKVEKTNKVVFLLAIVLLIALPVFFILIFLYLSITNSNVPLKSIIVLFLFLYVSKSLDILAQFYNNFFILIEKTYQTVVINFILTILNFILNWILIQRIGIIGGGIALLFCSGVKFFLFFIKSHRIAGTKLQL